MKKKGFTTRLLFFLDKAALSKPPQSKRSRLTPAPFRTSRTTTPGSWSHSNLQLIDPTSRKKKEIFVWRLLLFGPLLPTATLYLLSPFSVPEFPWTDWRTDARRDWWTSISRQGQINNQSPAGDTSTQKSGRTS